jgi:hypothetical protein
MLYGRPADMVKWGSVVRRCSSMVEHGFRKAGVVGSSPTIGCFHVRSDAARRFFHAFASTLRTRLHDQGEMPMESQQAPSTPEETSAKFNHRLNMVFVVIAIAALAGGALWWMGVGSYLVQRVEYASQAAAFSGDSKSLKQTVVVPTLDTPCPPGRNVIWCSSFQLAWNEVRDGVIKAPLEVTGAQEIADRLNAAKQSASDLDAKSVYATGGWIKDGIREKIEKDMAAKFPSHAPPDFDDALHEPNGILFPI